MCFCFIPVARDGKKMYRDQMRDLMRNNPNSSPEKSGFVALVALSLLFLASGAILGCQDDTADPEGRDAAGSAQVVPLTAQEQAQRENKAAALLKYAQRFSPVEKIEKLVDVAHVYHDTAAGPKAWFELVFYLLDHSNDDYDRAEKEVAHFARRCPNSSDLMLACLILAQAPLKQVMDKPDLPDAARRREVAEIGLKRWREVGERLCARPEFANDFGVHLECGNAHIYAKAYDDAARIWAKVEEFEEPAKDEDRMKVLRMRADIIRTRGGDKEQAKKLYLQVRDYQDKMAEHIPQTSRKYVDDALAELNKK